MEGQACFSPLEFLFNIAGELTVYENTEVKRVEGKVITTAGGDVTAEHIVFAGHFPFINRPGYYFARMHQDRSYCLALSGAGHMEGMYYGMDEGDYSFRGLRLEDKDLVILGGCNHRTGRMREADTNACETAPAATGRTAKRRRPGRPRTA